MMPAVPGRALRSEPLVHFAVLGLVIFGVHAAQARGHGEPLRVDADRVAATGAELARRLARAPAPAEIAAALVTELDEERLYREALALGLDRDDPIVRRRLIQKLRFVQEDLADDAAPPDDADLLALRDAEPDRYMLPARLAVTHVLAARDRHPDPEAAARELRARLLAGADPAALGDPCVHGQRLALRSASALAALFGDAFAAALSDMSEGTWNLAPSSLGWHVVRVDAREPAALPALATLRPRLRADWEAARREASGHAALVGLRARWPAALVDVEPAVAAALAEAER